MNAVTMSAERKAISHSLLSLNACIPGILTSFSRIQVYVDAVASVVMKPE
jgi:hypothetical protein